MSIAFNREGARTSTGSLIIVVSPHLALLAGLIYGLKTVKVSLPFDNHIDVAPIPPEHPLPRPDPTDVKVNFSQVVIHDYPPPPNTNPATIDEEPRPPNEPLCTNCDGGIGKQVAVTEKPADIFTGAVVDARSCDKPEYPPNSLRNGDEGVVTLELLIGTDGKVAESKVLKSSGHRELDKAAVAGLSLCKFVPARLNGQAQKSWAKLQYAWSVQNQ